MKKVMRFDELQLIEPLLRAVREEGYDEPTPIQQQAIPHVLLGRDLLGCAQTGTGKTAAFALPILQGLSDRDQGNGPRHIRALVLSPTRELATQIGDSFHAYGRHLRLKVATIYGGIGQGPQVDKLRRGVDILVATPGRLLDLMQQGFVKLQSVEVFVLDEADRMLDMGFLPDVRKVIAAVPHKRQTLMFSATMPKDIQKLADAILNNPIQVAVTPPATTVELTTQSVYFVEKGQKNALLQHILSDPAVSRVLVFTRTKHGANKVVKQIAHAGVRAEPIHSNKSQMAREKALGNFRAGRTRVLVATDIAARGIDVDNITHVINFDVPNEPETYVHRIGRTGRAGQLGIALSFCSREERPFLSAIERLIRARIAVAETPRSLPEVVAPPAHPDNHRSPQARSEDQRPSRWQRRGGNGNGPRRDPHQRGNSPAQGGQHAPKPAAAPKPHSSQPHSGQPQGQRPAGQPHSSQPQAQPPAAGRKPARPAPMPQHARRPRLVR